MLRGTSLLTVARSLFTRAESDVSLPGAISVVSETPADWLNRSVGWTLEAGDFGAEIRVWEDGNAEAGFFDLKAANAHAQHFTVADERDLQEPLRRLSAWVATQGRSGISSE